MSHTSDVSYDSYKSYPITHPKPEDDPSIRSSMPKALKYLIQLCKGKNFAIFIAVSLLQGID